MPHLWLVGFQGATRAGYRQFLEREPLLLTGHVGLSLDQGRTAFGFSPFTPQQTAHDVIGLLKRRESFPGLVRDDRALFVRAAQAAAVGLVKSPIYCWEQVLDDQQWTLVCAGLAADLARSPLSEKRYGWRAQEAGVYTCATWPSTLGVPIPEATEHLSDYIAALRLAAGGRIWSPT